MVERDTIWNGRRFIGPGPFYLARFDTDRPLLRPAALMLDEQQNLRGHAWCSREELAGLPDRLEPPTLAAVIATLEPAGLWAKG